MIPYAPPERNVVSPYLLVRDARRTLRFLSDVFGAIELRTLSRQDGAIMHAEVRIGDSVVMLGERPANDLVTCSVHVYVPDVDESYRNALQAGATSLAEPRDLPYGDRSAGLRDSDGTLWWIGTHRAPASR